MMSNKNFKGSHRDIFVGSRKILLAHAVADTNGIVGDIEPGIIHPHKIKRLLARHNQHAVVLENNDAAFTDFAVNKLIIAENNRGSQSKNKFREE